MSDLRTRSLDYAAAHGLTVIPLPGPFDACSRLIVLDDGAYLGLTEGTLDSHLAGELVYRACISLRDVAEMDMRVIARPASLA